MSFNKINGPIFEARGNNLTVVDNALPEMLHLIDAYWYQFPPMNSLWYGIIGFVMTCFGIVSLSGNFIVILVFTTERALRTPSNLYVVNLAVSDFMMMLTMFPPVVLNCYYETWVLGPFMCEIYAMCGSIFGCVSIYSMMMIAFDRYNVIVKGIAGTPLTTGGAVLRIFLIWLFCLFWTVAPMLGWNRYVPEGNMTACGTDYFTQTWLSRSYILAYSSFVYFLPLFTICYSYYFIIRTVSEHEKAMREQAKKMNVASLRSGEDKNKAVEFKLAKVALITISLWFMAWTPYLVINYAGIFGSFKLTPLTTIWGSIFAKANAIYNPIVYGISHPKYQAALYKKFPCLSCQHGGGDHTSDSASQVTEAEKQTQA